MDGAVERCDSSLKFLKDTQEETYGKIDVRSFRYIRIKEVTIDVQDEDIYYLGVS
jgi:hypothetical protein